MEAQFVTGGGGVEIATYEWGKADAPAVLLMHGFCQSHLCWRKQFESALADEFRLVAVDLRGHGRSGKPETKQAYQDTRMWADDVAAVIAGKRLNKPVLVGWSYAGNVMSDYVRHHGTGAVAGIDFVGATTKRGAEKGRDFSGAGIRDQVRGLLSDDLDENLRATAAFLRACTTAPMAPADLTEAMGYNMLVPLATRRHMLTRVIENDDVLPTVDVPVLVSHGQADAVVRDDSARHIARLAPHAELSLYPGIGHAPFYEAPERFNEELAAFVRRCVS